MKKFSSLACCLLLLGCGKIDFGPDEGITGRDERNQLTGAADATDWTTDATWSKKERALFHFDPAVDLNGPQQGGVRNLSFFPNPVPAASRRSVFSPGSVPLNLQVKLVIVDRKYKVLLEHEGQVAHGSSTEFMFNLSADKFANDARYRLYYVYYTADGKLYYKGHGDVKIAEQ